MYSHQYHLLYYCSQSHSEWDEAIICYREVTTDYTGMCSNLVGNNEPPFNIWPKPHGLPHGEVPQRKPISGHPRKAFKTINNLLQHLVFKNSWMTAIKLKEANSRLFNDVAIRAFKIAWHGWQTDNGPSVSPCPAHYLIHRHFSFSRTSIQSFSEVSPSPGMLNDS